MKIALALAMLLTSCGTWSKKDCNELPWREYGQEDAARGRPYERLRKFDYLNQCQRKGDGKAYEKLYEEGMDEERPRICTYAGGREYGLSGFDAPDGFCGKYDEKSFRRGITEALRDKNTSPKCTADADCWLENRCVMHTCEIGGGSCVTPKDCEPVGKCIGGRCELLTAPFDR